LVHTKLFNVKRYGEVDNLIKSIYNHRFLLASSAVSMGGIGIWSMHFIGNNSLTITYDNGSQHQLSYGPGFTFFSLIVAILVMFLAFAFVGITEEARIGRIIPSGILAGVITFCKTRL
jgi:NO-binding membrane sensor protein with MHYT domain